MKKAFKSYIKNIYFDMNGNIYSLSRRGIRKLTIYDFKDGLPYFIHKRKNISAFYFLSFCYLKIKKRSAPYIYCYLKNQERKDFNFNNFGFISFKKNDLVFFKHDKKYLVSKNGDFYFIFKFQNISFLKKIKKYRQKNGYDQICLGYKKYLVNRAVYFSFNKKEVPRKKYHVAHVDGNRSNNKISNLIHCSAKQNASHKVKHNTLLRGEKIKNSKLKLEDVNFIRSKFKRISSKKSNLIFLSKKFNVTESCIHKILKKQTWKHCLSEDNNEKTK